MSDEQGTETVKEITEVGTRLLALGNLALGLGHAIQGLCASGNSMAAKEFSETLGFVAKRISWLEKNTDPSWRPYDPAQPDRRKKAVGHQGTLRGSLSASNSDAETL
jgi:hypothetical protein